MDSRWGCRWDQWLAGCWAGHLDWSLAKRWVHLWDFHLDQHLGRSWDWSWVILLDPCWGQHLD